MDLKVTAGDITRTQAGAIIVTLFEELEPLEGDIATIDKTLDGAISQLISQGEIKGKLHENICRPG